jgi:hypothetical protein
MSAHMIHTKGSGVRLESSNQSKLPFDLVQCKSVSLMASPSAIVSTKSVCRCHELIRLRESSRWVCASSAISHHPSDMVDLIAMSWSLANLTHSHHTGTVWCPCCSMVSEPDLKHAKHADPCHAMSRSSNQEEGCSGLRHVSKLLLLRSIVSDLVVVGSRSCHHYARV